MADSQKTTLTVTITQALSELILAHPDLVIYEGKRIKFPVLSVAEYASGRPPGKFALVVEEDDGDEWVVTGIASETKA